MPCALVEPGSYPDYIKSILNEISAGNDDEAKACACSLRTPLTDEGCPITDEDGKLLAFPFCLIDTPVTGPFYNEFVTSSVGLSYKDAMRLYWSKTIDMEFSGYKVASTGAENCPVCISTGSTSFKSNELSNKDLVCGSSKGGAVDQHCRGGESCQPGYTIRGDGGCCYAAGSSYFGVELDCFIRADSFIDPPPEIPDSRGWIDKEAKLIYPYIYSLMNMGLIPGGNLKLTMSSGQSNGKIITLNGGYNTIKITPNMK
jgi:hypothetical protein